MYCSCCNVYFRIENSSLCATCAASEDIEQDAEIEVESFLLRNPKGKVQPVFYDREDTDDDSHGF